MNNTKEVKKNYHGKSRMLFLQTVFIFKPIIRVPASQWFCINKLIFLAKTGKLGVKQSDLITTKQRGKSKQSHHTDEVTSHQNNEFTTHQSDEVMTHQSDEVTKHQTNEVTTHQTKESQYVKLMRSQHIKLMRSQYVKLMRSQHIKLMRSQHIKLMRSRHTNLTHHYLSVEGWVSPLEAAGTPHGDHSEPWPEHCGADCQIGTHSSGQHHSTARLEQTPGRRRAGESGKRISLLFLQDW